MSHCVFWLCWIGPNIRRHMLICGAGNARSFWNAWFQSWDFVDELMTLVCLPVLVWLCCLGVMTLVCLPGLVLLLCLGLILSWLMRDDKQPIGRLGATTTQWRVDVRCMTQIELGASYHIKDKLVVFFQDLWTKRGVRQNHPTLSAMVC